MINLGVLKYTKLIQVGIYRFLLKTLNPNINTYTFFKLNPSYKERK